jgi:hypothetical protein
MQSDHLSSSKIHTVVAAGRFYQVTQLLRCAFHTLLLTITPACGGEVGHDPLDADAIHKLHDAGVADVMSDAPMGDVNPDGTVATAPKTSCPPKLDHSSEAVAIVSDAALINSLAIGAESLFFAGGSLVKKAPIAGGPVSSVANGNGACSQVHVAGEHVYWIEGSTSVRRVALSGGTPSTIVTGDLVTAFTVGVDSIYFPAAGKLKRIQLSGGVESDVAPFEGTVSSMAANDTDLYWIEQIGWETTGPLDFVKGRILHAPIGGGEPTIFINDLTTPHRMLLRSDAVYSTSGGPFENGLSLGIGAIWQFGFPEGTERTLACGGANPVALDTDGVSAYWIENGAASEVLGNVTTLTFGPTGLDQLATTKIGTAISDPTTEVGSIIIHGDFVYWSDFGRGIIWRSPRP